jgi:hypoxanthine phosphoribosyltransferase
VRGKNILVVEDIYDTGNSLYVMNECLKGFEPTSVKYAIIFHKKNPTNL